MAASSEVDKTIEDGDYEDRMSKTDMTLISSRGTGGGGAFLQLMNSKIPEVVDDFLRNFLRKVGLTRTLMSFEAEWYGSAQRRLAESLGMAASGRVLFIPDALTFRQLLYGELQRACADTHLLKHDVLVAGERLAKVQRERSFHRLLYRQVSAGALHLGLGLEERPRFKCHVEIHLFIYSLVQAVKLH